VSPAVTYPNTAFSPAAATPLVIPPDTTLNRSATKCP
jgi:hypothetical protein